MPFSFTLFISASHMYFDVRGPQELALTLVIILEGLGLLVVDLETRFDRKRMVVLALNKGACAIIADTCLLGA